jgi:hypothetical protein
MNLSLVQANEDDHQGSKIIIVYYRYYYCSPAEKKTWSKMFGIAPSTLSRTLIKAENALLLALSVTKEADVVWPSKADQIRIAQFVEKEVNRLLSRITGRLEINYF